MNYKQRHLIIGRALVFIEKQHSIFPGSGELERKTPNRRVKEVGVAENIYSITNHNHHGESVPEEWPIHVLCAIIQN